MPSQNVEKVMQVLQAHPQEAQVLHKALTSMQAKAGVQLSQSEKAELLQHMGNSVLTKHGAVVAWV